jgi:hypothetical protein
VSMMVTLFLANILSEFSLHHPAQRSIARGRPLLP